MSEERLAKLVEELFRLAGERMAHLRRIGEILVEMEDDDVRIGVYVSRLNGEYSISKSSTAVAMRWARGELGDNGVAKMLVEKIRHGHLAKISTESLAEMATKPLRYVSRVEGRIVETPLKDAHREDLIDNVDDHGFIGLDRQVETVPIIKSMAVTEIVEVNRTGVVYAAHPRSGTVHITVSHRLLKQGMKAAPKVNGKKAVAA